MENTLKLTKITIQKSYLITNNAVLKIMFIIVYHEINSY